MRALIERGVRKGSRLEKKRAFPMTTLKKKEGCDLQKASLLSWTPTRLTVGKRSFIGKGGATKVGVLRWGKKGYHQQKVWRKGRSNPFFERPGGSNGKS